MSCVLVGWSAGEQCKESFGRQLNNAMRGPQWAGEGGDDCQRLATHKLTNHRRFGQNKQKQQEQKHKKRKKEVRMSSKLCDLSMPDSFGDSS